MYVNLSVLGVFSSTQVHIVYVCMYICLYLKVCMGICMCVTACVCVYFFTINRVFIWYIRYMHVIYVVPYLYSFWVFCGICVLVYKLCITNIIFSIYFFRFLMRCMWCMDIIWCDICTINACKYQFWSVNFCFVNSRF